MKKILVICTMVFLGSGAYAQYEPEAKEILDKVSEKYQKMPAFVSNFIYKLENEEAGINEEMKGTIHVMDDIFKLELLSKVIFFDGELIREYDTDLQEYVIREYDSEEEEINLSSVLNMYKDGFKYYIRKKDTNGYTVELQPEDRNKSFFKIIMIIDTKSSIKSFTYFEKNGNLVTTEIESITEKKDLSLKFFDFFQSNLEVIDSVDLTDRF